LYPNLSHIEYLLLLAAFFKFQ